MDAGRSDTDYRAPELRLERVFDAPRALVFEAWTKPEHLARWFAPRPYTLPSCEVDLRVGGGFRCTMRSPTGEEHEMDGTYREIVVNERIVWVASLDNEPEGNEIVTTLTFTDEGAKTKLTVHQTYFRVRTSAAGAKQGWGMTLDQLAEVLAG